MGNRMRLRFPWLTFEIIRKTENANVHGLWLEQRDGVDVEMDFSVRGAWDKSLDLL